MHEDALQALLAWSWPSSPTIEVTQDGLINRTYLVTCAGRSSGVLQRLNTAIFVPQVHEDIEAVTRLLSKRGVPTPLLIPTCTHQLWHEDAEGGVWRCLTYEGDRTIHRVGSPNDARKAGELAARFHAAVFDLDWRFRSQRPGAHDTKRHMELLENALGSHRRHRLYDAVAPLADGILGSWRDEERDLPIRVIHGDLKISNIRYLGNDAHCLIDLDTIARDTLEVELGDAMRSWCNPASEDASDTRFDLGVFEAAMDGYAAGASGLGGPSDAEWSAIIPGVERITLELAARFARDALEERYFGFSERFGSRANHNLLRARGQLALARSIRENLHEAEKALERARRS